MNKIIYIVCTTVCFICVVLFSKLFYDRYYATNTNFKDIVEFQYKGHDYIWFHSDYNAGIEHSPDCKKMF